MIPGLRNFFIALLSSAVSLVLLSFPASAASLIRDAEIEMTLRRYADPILTAAQLTPASVNIFIVNDPAINAYVAGGSNMFIHTGLILAAEDPAMLIGVIAHEAGHIAGGHLAQGSEQLQNATVGAIISYVLGAAAALGGSGDVGSAVISAGQHVAQRNLLSFSRMNEQAADQAALQYLDSNKISASGLLDLMEKLRMKETLYKNQMDPYALTHPLSKERIAHIRGHLLGSDIPEKQVPESYQSLHPRMLAKLKGFLQSPEITLSHYPPEDQSLSARYARAVAYHRLSKTELALAEMDGLLAEQPDDPYFLELKGQILSESGRNAEALPYYRKASGALPDVALLHAEYGRELLSQNPPDYETALIELKLSTVQEPHTATTWRLLGECYGALQQTGQASLAYAEAALRSNKPQEALQQIKIALDHLPENSPARLRAEDLQAEAIRLEGEKKKSNGLG